MATQDLVQSLVQSIVSNPSLLNNLMEHPYSTVREASGVQDISREEAAQVVTATTALATGQEVDFGNLASMATKLLGQNNNSVHTLATSLLGSALGGAAAPQQASASSGLSANIISNLAGVAFGGGKANNKSAIDLSDGFGLDDAIGLLGMLLK